MFRNRKNFFSFRKGIPFKEGIVQRTQSLSGDIVSLSLGYKKKAIPLPSDYKLSNLLAAGVPLSPVSLDISTPEDVISACDELFNNENK